jgi:hypothetical protein
MSEQRLFGKGSNDTFGNAEDDERIEQRVGMVGDDEYRPRRHFSTAFVECVELVCGPTGGGGYPLR